MLTATDLIELAAVSFLASLLGSYVRRKGENLATKEDVAEITRKEEEVRLGFAKTLQELAHQNQLLIEQGTWKNQLRLAAIDRRLEAHQNAYALWWKLRSVANKRDEVGPVVMECHTWWVNNGLYLDKDARVAFYRAYFAAQEHPYLAEPGEPRDQSTARFIQENWEIIERAAEALEKGVELPSIRVSDVGVRGNHGEPPTSSGA